MQYLRASFFWDLLVTIISVDYYISTCNDLLPLVGGLSDTYQPISIKTLSVTLSTTNHSNWFKLPQLCSKVLWTAY